jgi:hypothetical protein
MRELVRVAGTQLDEALVLVFADLILSGEIVPPPSLADREATQAGRLAATISV